MKKLINKMMFSTFLSVIIACGFLLFFTSQPDASARTPPPDMELFTPFEKEMDKFVNLYSIKSVEALRELPRIRPLNGDTADWAIFYAHSCYFNSIDKRFVEIDRILKSLNERLVDSQFRNTVQAAVELCNLFRTNDLLARDKHTTKAFHFAKSSKAPLLRYWTSSLYVTLTTKQGRSSDAIEAAKIALRIANVNHDIRREANSLKALAMIEVDNGDKEEALAHIDQAITLAKQQQSDRMESHFLLNRGFILYELKRYSESKETYRKVEKMDPSVGVKDTLAVIWSNYADIAYREGQYEEAKHYALKTLNWGIRENDALITAFAKLTLALLALEDNSLSEAERLSKEGLRVFEAEKEFIVIRDFYENYATALERKSFLKVALKMLRKKAELSKNIERESRRYTSTEIRDLLKTETQEKENFALREINLQQNAQIERAQLNTQRWLFLALLLAIALLWFGQMFLEARRKNSMLQSHNEQLDTQRFQDVLTQLYNRRYVIENKDIITDKIEQQTAAILMVDADHFKHVNDKYGHAGGDAALVAISQRLKSSMRESDIVSRWGGEEFLICSFGCNPQQVRSLTSRIMTDIRNNPINFDGFTIPLSVSIGYVLMPLKWHNNGSIDFEKGIKLADAALYLAKKGGRNRALGVEEIITAENDLSPIFEDLDHAWKTAKVSIVETCGP